MFGVLLHCRRFLLLPTLLLYIFLGYLPLPAQQPPQTGNIVGQIWGSRGELFPERVFVTLTTAGAIVNDTYADTEGRFSFTNLRANAYHLIIETPGFRRVDELVTVNPTLNPNVIVRITLMPLDNESEKHATEATPGINPYLIGSAHAKPFAKKATKEFNSGLKAQEAGKSDDAIRHYENAVRIAPDYYLARNNLGSLYTARGDFQNAQAQFEEVIKLNQADAAAYFNLGNVCLLTSRYDQALDWIQEGLKRQPNSALGLFLVGSVYTRVGRLPEAEKSLKNAIQFDATMANARLALVNVYLQQRRRDDAIEQLTTFLQAFPNDPLAAKAGEVLKKLQGSSPPPAK